MLQPGHDRGVAVDDRVEDRVQHRLGAAAQQVGFVFEPVAHGGQFAGLAVADGEYEVAADEDVDFAEVDLFDVVEVAGGAQHHEQRVAVAFEFGPLVGDDRVFHGQFVQPELLGHGQQLRLGRPVQADPGHGVGLLAQLLVGFGEAGWAVDPVAVAVDRRPDHTLFRWGRRGGGSGVHRQFGRRRRMAGTAAVREPPGWGGELRAAIGHGDTSATRSGRWYGTGRPAVHSGRHSPGGGRPRMRRAGRIVSISE